MKDSVAHQLRKVLSPTCARKPSVCEACACSAAFLRSARSPVTTTCNATAPYGVTTSLATGRCRDHHAESRVTRIGHERSRQVGLVVGMRPDAEHRSEIVDV